MNKQPIFVAGPRWMVGSGWVGLLAPRGDVEVVLGGRGA
ncbi:GDP-fucose synthetase, partial [Salmonella enterica subsp. enterica serovar Enteritidis]